MTFDDWIIRKGYTDQCSLSTRELEEAWLAGSAYTSLAWREDQEQLVDILLGIAETPENNCWIDVPYIEGVLARLGRY